LFIFHSTGFKTTIDGKAINLDFKSVGIGLRRERTEGAFRNENLMSDPIDQTEKDPSEF